MNVDRIISMIERGMLPSVSPDALHAVLRTKGDNAYSVLSALESYSDAPPDDETKAITADLTRERADPMLAGRALRVLTIAWGRYAEYRSEILKAVSGLDWDEGGDYKLAATFCAGALLSTSNDKELLAAVLDRLVDSTELPGTRQAARDAILRAMGKDSRQIVQMSVALNSNYVPSNDEPVIWARGQIATRGELQ